MGAARGAEDEVERLAALFREHPAWREAARRVGDARATSDVYFTTRPGEVWHLALAGDHATLRPGRSGDPDFVFRFSPRAVEALGAAHDGLAGFAIALFRAMERGADGGGVDLRIAASFGRLLRRGYVRLLVAAGPRLVAFAARRGLHGLSDLRRLVESARTPPADWERPAD